MYSPSPSPPLLESHTLAQLDSFLAERADSEWLYNDLVRAGHEKGEKMSVDDFRKTFGEDWQLSQFWYSTRFATRLARWLHTLCTLTSASRVAFVSCPTAFVAFEEYRKEETTAYLFEYDTRFAVLANDRFVRYDLNHPGQCFIPEELEGNADVVVADPPFLNEETNRLLVAALLRILHPVRGKLLLLTATALEETGVLGRVYDRAPVGPLKRMEMEVEHEGGRLKNGFGCWKSWEGVN